HAARREPRAADAANALDAAQASDGDGWPAVVPYLFTLHVVHRALHSFPTRRSSDLHAPWRVAGPRRTTPPRLPVCRRPHPRRSADRKSTRLNSSHSQISYAVFCLKKKILDQDSPKLLPEDPPLGTDSQIDYPGYPSK